MVAWGSEVQDFTGLHIDPEARLDQSVNQIILKSRKYSKYIFFIRGLSTTVKVKL